MITPAETGTCHLEDGEVITIPGGSQGQKLRLTMWQKWPYEIGEILDL